MATISARLGTLIQTGYWEEIDDKVNEIRGHVVERSDNEMFVPAANMGEGRN